MSDTDLKDLLKNLRKINDVTRSNIDLLTSFLNKKESNASSTSKFLNDLSPSIFSLTQGMNEVKVKFEELSSGNPKCSKENSSVPVPLEEDSIQHNIQSECVDSVGEVSNGITGDAQKTATIDVGETCSTLKERLEDNEVKKNTEKCKEVLNGSSENTINKNVEKPFVEDGSEVNIEVTDVLPVNNSEDTINKIVEEPPMEDRNQDNIKVTEDSPADNTHSIEESIESKPMLKIIDFNKLVDPRNLELMNKNESRKNARKDSIIILSSSEDEPLITIKKDLKKQRSLSHVQEPVKVLNPKKNNTASKNIPSHMKDIKLRSSAYVRLLRISPEKMKEYYSRFEMNMKSSDESIEESVSRQNKRRNCRKDTQKTRSKAVVRRKKQLRRSSDSDTSDDEISNSTRHKAEPKQDSSRGKKICNSDMKKCDVSKDDKENFEKDKISDSKSESDSETFLNLKKKASYNENEESQLSNEKVNISSSDDEQNSHNGKEEADKEYCISSDDSDVDTFFRKNKFVKKKKQLVSSESDEENCENSKSDNFKKNSNSKGDNSDKEDEDVTKKKRRRIKTVDNSSESDDLTTRKKIKRLISKDSLSEQTKKAAAEERERKQRILEKQKKYNQIYEGIEIASSKVDKLILDIDEKTGEPLLEVDKKLLEKLKPHQASGIQFMWDACFESLHRIKNSKGSGCILAHCMGLGKTLQVIALTNTLLESDDTNVKKVLIVTPLSTVLNWKAEFKNWLSGEESFDVYEMITIRSSNADRASCLKAWHEAGGVMIISYAMFRNLSNDKNKRVSKKFRTIFMESLVDPGPDLVVCDEGHLLKNEKTNLSQAMSKIKTSRRIVLTGTPLQNNLKEYYCMVQFVKPNLLGTYKEYMNRFVNPITNGQYTDSTQYDINIMRRRSHVLHKLLDGIVQRRDYSVLAPYLPPKHEYVLFLTLTDVQVQLYRHYMDHFAKGRVDETSNRASYLFKDFQAFTRICIHPRVLLDKSIDDQQKYQSDEESIGSLKDFIDDNQSTTSSDMSDDDSGSNKNRKVKRATRANPKVTESDSEEDVADKKEWWQEYCDGEELDNIAHSTKLMLLFEILKECEQIGDKVLVFSQSLYALNLIEYFLEKIDEATQNGDADKKTCGFTGSWTPGLDYFRLDGSTNCGLRNEWCDSFNKDNNSRARLFLLSTRAGGLGINLVAANRVILFDVSWNPSSDVQSIYRVYRFGQLKPSYIYRFVTYGTMEMKIYERQVTKQAISKRVIDEQQIDRHYNQNDLAALYNFEAPDRKERPIPMVPKDILLGEMLQNHDDKIFKFHEHQSLLENKEDETLNEEERKAAWDEFENEKVERTKQVLIGSFTIPTIQLAMRNIIQRDNPTWNNNQILSIIPQLTQQLNMQLAAGDQTMYMRIAEEVKIMQVNYAKKVQMQYLQYQMQRAAAPAYPNPYPNPLMNPLAHRFAIPGVSGYNNPMRMNPNVVSNTNSNEIVELN